MPTGYTAAILEKDISFEEFALNCARAFGALIHMRDESHDSQITLPAESDYHTKALERAREGLYDLQRMTDNQIVAQIDRDYEERIEENRKGIQKALDDQQKLTAMLAKVEAWDPPSSDHQGLKDFMIDQINITIKGDCNTSYYDKPVVKLSVEEWKENRLAYYKRDIAYHTQHQAEDRERNNGRREWITKLFESIGQGHRVKDLKEIKF